MRPALLSLALCSACYSPAYRDCDVTCATSQACPGGFSCNPAGFCVADLGTSCGVGADGGMDGNSDAADAAMLGPWGMPRPVEFVPGTPMGLDDQPTLTDNMLLLYVHRRINTTPPQNDIYGASRSSMTAQFPSPGSVDVNLSSSNETTPELTPTGLEVYFSSNRSGGTSLDIFYANRASLTSPFSVPIAVAELNSTADEGSPAISRDGMTIVWASSRSGIVDMLIATRQSMTMAWSPPVMMTMAMVNDAAFIEDNPFLSTDKLTIYFTSNRSGDYALWTATRPDTISGFGMPSRIVELDIPNTYDGDPWVSADGRTIFFTRLVNGVVTLMYATR